MSHRSSSSRSLRTAAPPATLLGHVALALAVVLVCTRPASAQLALDGSGNVAVGTEQVDANQRLRVQHGQVNEGTRVVSAELTGTGDFDAVAVYGQSLAGPDWGIGGELHGGWAGAVGRAQVVGPGTRHGVNGRASGGATANYGLWGAAQGDAGTKYGVWATASGAGTNYAGFFDGNVHVTGVLTQASDGRFKRDVQPLAGRGVLGRVRELRPNSYEYVEGAAAEGLHFGRGRRYGFIAQEVEAVFPELVTETVAHVEAVAGASGRGGEVREVRYRSVNYQEMVPLLVQALQEQQEQIAALQARVEALERGRGQGNGNP